MVASTADKTVLMSTLNAKRSQAEASHRQRKVPLYLLSLSSRVCGSYLPDTPGRLSGCQHSQYSSFGIESFTKPPHIDGEFDFEPFRRAEAIANVDVLDFKGSLAGTHHYVDTIPCEWIRTPGVLAP